MRKQLLVIKADGSAEEYLHTKVWATLNHAFDSIGESDSYVTEQLADVVTYYLYHHDRTRRDVPSSEVLAIIKVVLTNTGYDEAALSLCEYHRERQLRRNRIEVIDWGIQDWSDAQGLSETMDQCHKARWNKSIIINDLRERYAMSIQTARAIAAMAEEKILNMGVTAVSSAIVKQLVLSDAATVLRAQEQLQLIQ